MFWFILGVNRKIHGRIDTVERVIHIRFRSPKYLIMKGIRKLKIKMSLAYAHNYSQFWFKCCRTILRRKSHCFLNHAVAVNAFVGLRSKQRFHLSNSSEPSIPVKSKKEGRELVPMNQNKLRNVRRTPFANWNSIRKTNLYPTIEPYGTMSCIVIKVSSLWIGLQGECMEWFGLGHTFFKSGLDVMWWDEHHLLIKVLVCV